MIERGNFFGVVLIFLAGSSALHAESYFAVRVLGDPTAPGDAKSLAMGGAHADYDPPPRRTLSITGASVSMNQLWTESGTQTRSSDGSHSRPQALTLRLPSWTGQWEWRIFAATMMDFSARSSYRIYNSTGLPAGENRFMGAGELLKIGGGMTVPVGSRLSLRMDSYRLIGRESLQFGKYPLNSLPALDLREEARYGGFAGEVGLWWRPARTLGVAAAYRPPAALKRSYRLAGANEKSAGEKWRLPPQAVLGFNIQPSDTRSVEMRVEVKRIFWRRAAVDGKSLSGISALKPIFREVLSSTGMPLPAEIASLRLRDVTEIGVGINHEFAAWSFQYGFRYKPFYADRRAETTAFSAGVGYRPNGRWQWSLGGELAKRDFLGDGVVYPSGWRVAETLREIRLTVERSW